MDAGIAESFPASDPVSVFITEPLPREHSPGGTEGIPWKALAAGSLPLAGLVAAGARFLLARRHAAALRAHRRQNLLVLATASGLVALGITAHAKWRERQVAVNLEEDPPLFV